MTGGPTEEPSVLSSQIEKIQLAASEPKRILIIDDNVDDCEKLRRLLRDYRVVLDEANSGRDGVTAAMDHNYHMILLDVHMPGELSGVECFDMIRLMKKGQGIRQRIVLISGEFRPEARAVLDKVGFIVFAYKPRLFEDEFLRDWLGALGIEKIAVDTPPSA